MKVIIVKPFTNPFVKEIKGDLESMQAVVGGYIQAIYPFDDEVALVCNEEGKINGLMPNRFLLNRNNGICDYICGDFSSAMHLATVKTLKVCPTTSLINI